MDAPALAPTDTQADEDTLARQTQDEYDQIPDLYQSSKQLPFRTYVEAPSMLALLGPDVARQSIIDLACGEGFYTRKIRNMGCPDVVGIDLSPEMIHLAQRQESQRPLGIRYLAADVRDLAAHPELAGRFDTASAGFLLNYATSYDHLLQMLRGVHHVLKPGGRFVSINDSFLQDPATYGHTRPHGYTKAIAGGGARAEGSPIAYTFWGEDGQALFTFHNFWLSPETYKRAFAAAGFSSFAFRLPSVAPEGEAKLGAAYFAPYLNEQEGPFLMLEAHK